MTVEVGNGCPSKNIPSVERNEDQNVPSVIQGDVSGVSFDKNMHYEHTRRMRDRKFGWALFKSVKSIHTCHFPLFFFVRF